MEKYTKEELVEALKKIEKEYPAVYKHFLLAVLEEKKSHDPVCNAATTKSQCYCLG